MPINPGSYTALLTPYSQNGEKISEASLEALINHIIDQGVDGLYAGGSTAETYLQSYEERVFVLEIVAKIAKGRTSLIAQVGDINPQVCHKLARVAANAGYNAVSSIPPFYFKYDWKELLEFYRVLASQTDLPFLVYNIPALTGVTLNTDQITELLHLPNVIGLKNTILDFYGMEQLVRTNPDKLIFNGYDETALSGLAMGACGVIGTTLNVQGYKFKALRDAYLANENDKARAIQGEINELIDAIVPYGVLRSVKYLLDLQGIPMGDCRPPFSPLTEAGKSAMIMVHERLLSR